MFSFFLTRVFVLIPQILDPWVSETERVVPARIFAIATFASYDIVAEYFRNVFVLLILVLFLVSLASLLHYRWLLRSQWRAFNFVKDNCDQVLKAGETNPDAIRPELLKQVEPVSIAAHRVEELHWIRVHGGDF